MRLTIYTARLSYRGDDRLDVTRATADAYHAAHPDKWHPGEPFAPSWGILRPALDARKAGWIAEHWPSYAEAYRQEMRESLRRSYQSWGRLLEMGERAEITFCCGCRDPQFCHRRLLADLVAIYARSCGVEVVLGGERGASAMRALSLWQPWASFMTCGAKTIETRSWGTAYRGPVAIHAAKTKQEIGEANRLWREAFPEGPSRPYSSMPLGCVVALAELVDCFQVRHVVDPAIGMLYVSAGDHRQVPRADLVLGDLSPGRWGWRYADVRPLHEPIPCRGMQGLFPLPAEVEAKVRAQVDQADAERAAIAEEGASS